MNINDQKVQVADEIKRDIQLLVANFSWWQVAGY